MTGVAGKPLSLHLTNAGDCSFPVAWQGYQACASYDLERWFRYASHYTTPCIRVELCIISQHIPLLLTYMQPCRWSTSLLVAHSCFVACCQACVKCVPWICSSSNISVHESQLFWPSLAWP